MENNLALVLFTLVSLPSPRCFVSSQLLAGSLLACPLHELLQKLTSHSAVVQKVLGTVPARPWDSWWHDFTFGSILTH